MNIVITGGSGFIGSNLTAALKQLGHHITVFDRTKPQQAVDDFVKIDLTQQDIPPEKLTNQHAIIHLAGRNLLGRLDEKRKDLIYQTRILSTRKLIETLRNIQPRPAVVISASAIGYYGNRPNEELSENSPPGGDFLAMLCVEWEKEARQAESLGIRTVQMRMAPVLGRSGILDRMLPLYRLGLGGPLGSGTQWFPWIHISDLTRSYLFALENTSLRGPVNAVSPSFVTNQEFSTALAAVLNRPTFLHVPIWALRLGFKDLAETMLSTLRIHPTKLQAAGFSFTFTDVQRALEEILSNKS